jgi:hypothetical protein
MNSLRLAADRVNSEIEDELILHIHRANDAGTMMLVAVSDLIG